MTQARFNIYSLPHNAIRYALAKLSQLAGATDYQANEELTILEKQMDLTLTFLKDHVSEENKWVHSLLKENFPKETENLERDHAYLCADLEKIQLCYDEIKHTPVAKNKRNEIGHQFYMLINKLHATELQHMQYEEEVISEKLWQKYTDKQLVEVTQQIAASISPQTLLKLLASIIPGANLTILKEILTRIKGNMPTEFFAQVSELANSLLSKTRLSKLKDIIRVDTQVLV